MVRIGSDWWAMQRSRRALLQRRALEDTISGRSRLYKVSLSLVFVLWGLVFLLSLWISHGYGHKGKLFRLNFLCTLLLNPLINCCWDLRALKNMPSAELLCIFLINNGYLECHVRCKYVIWVVLQWGCYTAFWLWWDSMPLLSVSAYYHSWQSTRFLSCSCISIIHLFELNSLPLITITWNIGLIAILQCLSRPFPHFCDFMLHTPHKPPPPKKKKLLISWVVVH